MKIQRLAIALTALTALNLILLLFALVQGRTTVEMTTAQTVAPALRAQAIELVDDRGQVRAQLSVESSGEAVFRLRDAKGTIRVKLAASEEGSGLLLLDDSTNPGAHILAKRDGASLTLMGKEGRQQVFRP